MGEGIVIPDDVAALVESGEVAIWLATANAECIPQTTRAMGARLDRERVRLELYVPREQGARLLANARDGQTLAATFVRVRDYRAVQAKGPIARVRGGRDDERGWPERYREAFADACQSVGMPRQLVVQLTYWPSAVIEVDVRELYAQTPGPNAGARL